jgi:hypothetical protein
MAADAATSWLKIVDEDLRQVVNNLQRPLPSPAGAAGNPVCRSNRDVEERNRDCPLDVLTFSLNLPAPSP